MIRKLDYSRESKQISDFLKEELAKAGMKKYIIGLSGGIDSAVSAALAVKAVGKDNVIGLMLPYTASNPASLADAKSVAAYLKIDYHIVPISPMVEAYFAHEKTDDILRRGNFMARTRMCVLYDYSARYQGLVLGTGNKSELMIGYCTQYGDSACANEPLSYLYKTEVFELARQLGLPPVVINKKPSADLWDAQTDEAELGMTYNCLDNILEMIIEQGADDDTILAMGYATEIISKVHKMIANSQFKRQMPATLEDLWLS